MFRVKSKGRVSARFAFPICREWQLSCCERFVSCQLLFLIMSAKSTKNTAAAHSDEIILPPAKAQAAGVEADIIEPGVFNQVIKTSGQVMAAQGDESVAVATVAGVVSFHGKVVEGMSVSKGTPLVVLSSKNMADGDPVQRARIAY